jgi:aminopeptidase N
MRYLFALLLASFSIISSIQAQHTCFQHEPKEIRNRNVDYLNLDLHVSFDTSLSIVNGKASYSFKPMIKNVDSLYLDAVDINLDKIKLDGVEQNFKVLQPQGIVIYLKNKLDWEKIYKLEIDYSAKPKRGLYFHGWNEKTNRQEKQIWTQGQGIDNRHWIPIFDDPIDKITTNISVEFNPKYKVLSNGVLQKPSKEDKALEKKTGNKVWRYVMSKPHASYLIMLGIGDYGVHYSKSKSGVPIQSWYYSKMPERREPTYRYTEQIMDFFESEIGVNYPWETYSQIPVVDFLYGAMENTTATVFGDFLQVDSRMFQDKNYVGVNAHEMAHQWFGDLITAKSATHLWLQETFATHYAKLAQKHLFGEDNYDLNRYREAKGVLAQSITNKNPIAFSSAGSIMIYQKGSFVLDMLKKVIGREEYNKAVKYYLEQNKYNNVTTYDFEDAFHDVLGYNLKWFFDQWIRRGGEPHYQVKHSFISSNNKNYALVEVEQIQEITNILGYFKMPIDIEVYYSDGTTQKSTHWIENQSQNLFIEISKNKTPVTMVFDANQQILKRLTHPRSYDELIYVAKNGKNLLDRLEALESLRNTDIQTKKEDYLTLLKSKNNESIVDEILGQLAKLSNDKQVNDVFFTFSKSNDNKIRKSVANHLTQAIANNNDYSFMLKDSSYSIIETMFNKLCTWYPQNFKTYLSAIGNTKGFDNKIRILALKYSVQINNLSTESKEFKELADMCTEAWEFRTRINAFDAVKELGTLNQIAVDGIKEASNSYNGRLAAPAKETIKYLKVNHQLSKYFD